MAIKYEHQTALAVMPGQVVEFVDISKFHNLIGLWVRMPHDPIFMHASFIDTLTFGLTHVHYDTYLIIHVGAKFQVTYPNNEPVKQVFPLVTVFRENVFNRSFCLTCKKAKVFHVEDICPGAYYQRRIYTSSTCQNCGKDFDEHYEDERCSPRLFFTSNPSCRAMCVHCNRTEDLHKRGYCDN